MSAKFYAEDLGISMDHAERLAWFMELSGLKAVESKVPWAKHGKVRVYIELWSQNRRPAVDGFDKCYYDAVEDDVFVSGAFSTGSVLRLSDLSRMRYSLFSGARTRGVIQEFCEVFYEQKANRD